MRSGAESPDDRLLNLERHGEQVGRGAAPHPASPARSGERPAVPTPRATPPRTLGRQPRPLPLGGGGGGTHSPLGVETKTKPRTRCAHTCTHTQRVLNQAAAGLTGLTGQQRRRRQRKEPVSPRRRAAWQGVAASSGGESGRAGGRTTCRGVPRALGTNPWGTGDVHSSRKLGHALPRSPPTCGSLGDGDLVFRGDVPPPPPLQPARGSVPGATGTPAPQGAQSTRPPPSPAVGPAGTGRLSARLPV